MEQDKDGVRQAGGRLQGRQDGAGVEAAKAERQACDEVKEAVWQD